MNRTLRSVGFQLPALLMVMGLLLYTLSLLVALQRATETGLASRQQSARSSLSAIARMLAELDYRHDTETTRELVAQLGAMSDVDGAVFVGADGSVRAATRRDAIGGLLDTLEWRGAAARIARVVATDHAITETDSAGYTQVAIPVRSGVLDARGEITRRGILLARLDLRPLVRDVRRNTLRFYATMAIFSLIAVTVVALFLHLRVAGPAFRIAEAADRNASGDRSARTGLRGNDELAQVGRAFDRMVEQVAESEERLRHQQGLLDGLLATIPVGVFVVDRVSRRILYANGRMRELGGYDVPVGCPIAELGGHRERASGAPVRIAELPVERALTEGRPVHEDDLVYVHPDGTRVPVMTTAHPMTLGGAGEFDAVLAVVQDRRGIERAFAQLKASEERFQNASLATGQAMYEWDVDSDRCRFSDSLTSVFGYAPSDLDANDKWNRIIHPEDVAAAHRAFEVCVRERRIFDHVHRVRHADGRWLWVRDRGVIRYDAAGRAVQMTGSVADITEQRELEARLVQAQKMETVGTLAGGVAHDFNNQLTGVLGHLDLLGEELDPGDDRQEHVRVARMAAQRCAELTRGLLAFSRMLRGEARPVNVNAVVDEAVTLLRRVLPATIRLDVQRGSQLPAAQVDPAQLQQVILNLCVNARDAMPGGGTLHIVTDAVHVADGGAHSDTASPGDYVRVTVRDEGVGIPADVMPRIFEPFFTTKPVGAGTGLGLSMVYGIVAQHRGWVDVESTPGTGATFRVHVPCAVGASTPVEVARETGAPRPVPPARTVLVVDDEAVVRNFAGRLLERNGCNVLTAGDGAEALARVAEHPGRIDAVLLDLTMPGMPVRDVVTRLLALSPRPRVVLTSGYAQQASGQSEFDGLAFLAKPYTPAQLLDRLCAPEPPAA